VSGTILVVTASYDQAVETVLPILDEMGEKYFRLNTDRAPIESWTTNVIRSGSLGGEISNGERTIDAKEIKSCWHRRSDKTKTADSMHPGYAKFVKGETHFALWSFYTTLPNAIWVNHPLIGARLLEGNKLYQMRAALDSGILVPDTIVSSSPEELIAFSEEHGGRVAVKVMRANILAREGSEELMFVYTNTLSTEDLIARKDAIRISSIMAQEYIPKEFELRVTVVGNEIFACSIDSQNSEVAKEDWRRYDFDNVAHERFELPEDVKHKLLNMMRGMGLVYGAIDLIVTPNGKYIFLEVNPSGQWGWIEGLTGMKISESIARILADPTT